MKPAFPFAASTAALAALAAAAVFAATPALAAQTASGSISSPAKPAAAPDAAGNEAAPAPATATAPAAPAALPAATPEQQAALAGARPAPAGIDPAHAPTATGSLLTTIFSLILVLALLVGLAWLLKRFGPKTITGGANVKLVGALSVGARERILVVEVGEHWIVVGASPGRMNSLATLPRQENAAAFDHAAGVPGALPGANFAEWFKQTIEKRNGK
jgi:flagellar biosynthetic protein FliO